MMNEKVGTIAGQIWTALSENGALSGKDLKKAAKVRCDKDLYLGLGWLLRESKVTVSEEGKEIVVALN
ncbi:MAG: winged helix-turn-helix domain-containing protein [Prevotellaceae bacterium]|nr:winged helix-turn-helix domain-containing protein [Prevotellaceae bacterium]MCD8304226.1 winged helix-turn-helix domain-containing protein [Prevotellaceae bacterium]